MTLVTISHSGIVDLSTVKLQYKKQRIQNIINMIKLCPVLRILGEIIPRQNEFLPMERRVLR